MSPPVEPTQAARSTRWRTAGTLVAVSVAGLAGILLGSELTTRSSSLIPTRQGAPTVVVLGGKSPQDQAEAWRTDAGPTEAPPYTDERVQVAGRDTTRPAPGIDGAARLEPDESVAPRHDDGGAPEDRGPPPPPDAAAPLPPEAGALDTSPETEVATATPAQPVITCGDATCPAGTVCCNESCGICAPPGERCDQRTCGVSYLPVNPSCGHNTCAIGEVCCNPSCGICVSPDETCDQRVCDNPIVTPVSRPCGMNTCNIDEVCCNPSCGICREFGEVCSREVCD